MTALTLFFKREAVRTVSSPRRLFVVVILLAIIAAAGIMTLVDIAPTATRNVSYEGTTLIEPRQSALCPGEALVYMQHIHVTSTGMVDISREWCVRDGVCSLDLHQHWENVVLTPLDFTGIVSRTVPVSPLFRPGGEYEFRSGVQNGELSVQIVPFTIREDCQQ